MGSSLRLEVLYVLFHCLGRSCLSLLLSLTNIYVWLTFMFSYVKLAFSVHVEKDSIKIYINLHFAYMLIGAPLAGTAVSASCPPPLLLCVPTSGW